MIVFLFVGHLFSWCCWMVWSTNVSVYDYFEKYSFLLGLHSSREFLFQKTTINELKKRRTRYFCSFHENWKPQEKVIEKYYHFFFGSYHNDLYFNKRIILKVLFSDFVSKGFLDTHQKNDCFNNVQNITIHS